MILSSSFSRRELTTRLSIGAFGGVGEMIDKGIPS
jgi:hypothetical protein